MTNPESQPVDSPNKKSPTRRALDADLAYFALTDRRTIVGPAACEFDTFSPTFDDKQPTESSRMFRFSNADGRWEATFDEA